MIRKFLAISSSIVILVACNPLFAFQATEVPDRELLEQRAVNLESFEMIWTTIRDQHWDEDLVGDSWDKHREELLPKIEAAKSTDEARDVMTELISRLEQSHFGLIPASSYEAMNGEDAGGGSSDVGITVRLVEGDLVVTELRSQGPAEKAGVKPGWTITKIRGKSSADLIERFKNAAHGPQRFETIVGLATGRMMSDQKNKLIKLEFVDEANQTRPLELKCTSPGGKMASLGNLPPMLVVNETRTLSGNIGYFRFNAFLDPMTIMPAYRKAIRDQSHSKGLVLDLRGNFGGIVGMTMGMAGEFVSKQTRLGTMSMKGSKLKLFANRNAKPISVPVAVLVDECSISAAEFLAGGLQDNDLARVFGQRTAGLALPSVVVKLPNGDGFQYAIADYHSASGEALEMKGVLPDEKIEVKKQDLLQGNDPALQAALRWIKQKDNK